jgi:hypothetical protein
MSQPLLEAHLRPDAPDLLDLPWHVPLEQWREHCARVLDLERGVSRHEVQFVSYGAHAWAIKRTSVYGAEKEYQLLAQAEDRRLPCVRPAGWLVIAGPDGSPAGMLVTEFLEGSLPYRTLFRARGLERYRDRLLDAMAGLFVRLHLAGVYWGDCSLSNTLFRRDAGELSAYLVDAETSEVHESLSTGQREQDLLILEENVAGEMSDLVASGEPPHPLDPWNTGHLIRERYARLWHEVTREELVAPGEEWRVQERVRALNALGFSVGEIELLADKGGSRLRLRTIVTDGDYHRHELHNLTGLSMEEHQARRMLNEVRELRAEMARALDRSVSLSAAAYRWQRERFEPAAARLAPLASGDAELAERYCQVLEHKWFLSERERRDVGLAAALDDYLRLMREPSRT